MLSVISINLDVARIGNSGVLCRVDARSDAHGCEKPGTCAEAGKHNTSLTSASSANLPEYSTPSFLRTSSPAREKLNENSDKETWFRCQ